MSQSATAIFEINPDAGRPVVPSSEPVFIDVFQAIRSRPGKREPPGAVCGVDGLPREIRKRETALPRHAASGRIQNEYLLVAVRVLLAQFEPALLARLEIDKRSPIRIMNLDIVFRGDIPDRVLLAIVSDRVCSGTSRNIRLPFAVAPCPKWTTRAPFVGMYLLVAVKRPPPAHRSEQLARPSRPARSSRETAGPARSACRAA